MRHVSWQYVLWGGLWWACLNPTATAEVVFTAETVDANVGIGYGVAVGDVDGDGRPDLLLADKTEIAWYQNPGQRQQIWRRSVMARQLTPRDNVCLAARDLDGDGRVEVAVGANWNPGETRDVAQSGAVFYLRRPHDPHQLWEAVPLQPHEPTVHRMSWVRWTPGNFRLLVLPLHGRGNRDGQGDPVRLRAYEIPLLNPQTATSTVVHEAMHMTHNLDFRPEPSDVAETVVVGGREGLVEITAGGTGSLLPAAPGRGAGEVRTSKTLDGKQQFVTIEPMHGNEVVLYRPDAAGVWQRRVLDNSLQQGHALAVADLMGQGQDQIVAGWRDPNAENRVGIRLYIETSDGAGWQTHVIDDNQMACEDLRVADLDADGRLDIVAAGRATNNLVIYWNQ